MNILSLGVYKHYKGSLYQVVSVGTHTETGEELVIYHAINDTAKVWVRPLSMFIETVEVNGRIAPRFEKID